MKPFTNKIINTAAQAREALLDVLYPRKCAACGRLTGPVAKGAISFLCHDCAQDFMMTKSPLCLCCGMPFVSLHGPDHVCGRCMNKKNRFKKARAAGVYDGPLRSAIHSLKYRKKTSLARPMGNLLEDAFFRYFASDSIDLAVPVPLHRRRLKHRGFNQALILVKNWGYNGTPPVFARALSRIRWTESQAGLKTKERAKNIKGAFAVNQPEQISGKRILLIDDVLTTGATANECARVLVKAGARQVDVLTLAVVVR